MTKKTSMSVTPRGRSNFPSEDDISPAQRERMIREAAYFRYVQRGSVPGHDLDDWLAVEAEIFGGAKQQLAESVEATVFEMQTNSAHSFWEEDALKRIIKQHPQKDIPQVEGIESQEAPPKE